MNLEELVLLMLHDGEIGVIDSYTLTHEPQALVWYESEGKIQSRAINCRLSVTLADAVRTKKEHSQGAKRYAEERVSELKKKLAELSASIKFLDSHPIGNNVVDKYQDLLDFRGNSSRPRRSVSDGDIVIQGEYVGWLYDHSVTRTHMTRKVSWGDNDTSGAAVAAEDIRWIRDEGQAKEARKMLRAAMLKRVLSIRSERLRIAHAEKELESMGKYETGEKPKILLMMEATIEFNRKREEKRREEIEALERKKEQELHE